MKLREFGALLSLAATWGTSFLLIGIAAPELGPFTLVNARMLIASSMLLLYVFATRRERPALGTTWKPYLILGLLNSVLPLILEAFAVMHLSASLAAILATTAPLFTALSAALWLHERLTLSKLGGLGLGMVGVSVLVGWNTLPFSYTVGLALGASLVSALFYALASVYVRVTFQKTPALSLAIGQEIVAGFMMLPISAVVLPPRLPSLPAIAATIILALVMTASGNLLYFYLINHIEPAKTQSVAFLVPVIAVLASAVFVGEPLTNGTLLGLSIILASLVLVTEVRLQIPRLPVVAALLRAAELGRTGTASLARSAALPTSTRPFRGWPTTTSPLYDRHSTRRQSQERDSVMCA